MSLENSTSKIIHKGNGSAKVFSFSFKVWKASQVRVILADREGSETDVTSQVTVSVSATGGTVTFGMAPAEGTTLAILRSMPFVQEDRYITGTRFDPHEIEDALDVACAERQELKELALRHLTVPATSSKTPEQVMTAIFDTVATANEYAQKAVDAYNASVALKDTVEQQVTQTGDEQVERVEQTGESEVQDVTEAGQQWQSAVTSEGQVQIDRLAGYADVGALAEGLAAAMQVWKLDADVPAGSTIVLPNELKYIPGHHHLWLSYGGLVISPTFFTEVGEANTTSTKFVTKIPFKAGQELMAWVIPLGRVYEVELTDRVVALEEALADLSRRVVYADATNNANMETIE